MNYFFKSNAFARVWKIAEVTCVPNAGDTGNQSNNWPISLLPVLKRKDLFTLVSTFQQLIVLYKNGLILP